MRTNEELREKHGENRYPQSPLRVCPNCFLVDYHASKAHDSECAECGRWSDEGFPLAGSKDATDMILAAISYALNETSTAAQRCAALDALAVIQDDWEWKK